MCIIMILSPTTSIGVDNNNDGSSAAEVYTITLQQIITKRKLFAQLLGISVLCIIFWNMKL